MKYLTSRFEALASKCANSEAPASHEKKFVLRLEKIEKRTKIFACFILILSILSLRPLSGQSVNTYEYTPGVSEVIEKVGKEIPLDMVYRNEVGDTVRFGDLLEKPTLIQLVYYTCPGICNPLLSGATKAIAALDLTAGKDYKAIALSFNELETPEVAASKKANYIKMLNADFPAEEWHWLTGNNRNIKKLTRAVGFQYKAAGIEFVHPPVMVVVSPAGKIVRYFHGTSFSAFDLKMTLIEASDSEQLNLTSQLLHFLYQYDDNQTYRLHKGKAFGSGIFLMGLLFGVFFTGNKRRA